MRQNLFRSAASLSQLFLISSSTAAVVTSTTGGNRVVFGALSVFGSSLRSRWTGLNLTNSGNSKTTLKAMSSTSTPTTDSGNLRNRCLVYGKNGKVEEVVKTIKPISNTKVKHGHVLVRVYAAGLNPVDAKFVIGDKLPFDTSGYVKGYTIGFEFSGVVVQTANNEDMYRIGDEVFGTMPPLHGTLSDYIMAPKHQIYHKPKTLSFIEAAGLPLVGLTALQALRPYVDSAVAGVQGTKKMKSLLVIGAAGGTGHVAIQVSKCLGGYDPIIAVCSPRKSEFCKGLGATHVVDYTNTEIDIADQVRQVLKNAIAGNNPDNKIDTEYDREPTDVVDIVFDCVTSADERDSKPFNYPHLFKDMTSTRYIRLGGRTRDWFYAGCERFLGDNTIFGKEKLFWIKFPQSSQQLKQLQEWCDDIGDRNKDEKVKKLAVHVGKVFRFNPEDVQQAMDDIMTRRVQGKLIVEVHEAPDAITSSEYGG